MVYQHNYINLSRNCLQNISISMNRLSFNKRSQRNDHEALSSSVLTKGVQFKLLKKGNRPVLQLPGIGHRWSVLRVSSSGDYSMKGSMTHKINTNKEINRLIKLDAGTSHSICYFIPTWIGFGVQSNGTKRKPSLGGRISDSLRAREKGCRIERRCLLRPRSDYTGKGIVNDSVVYPKLKSTKTSKK